MWSEEEIRMAVTEIGPLDDRRAAEWPSIEVDHAVALTRAVLQRLEEKRRPPTPEQFEELKKVLPKPHADLDH